MRIFLITEACFHTAFLFKNIKEKSSIYEKNDIKLSIIVRNKTNLNEQKLTQIHQELKNKQILNTIEKNKLLNAYNGSISLAEEALITLYGVPDIHSLSLPLFSIEDNLNSPQLLEKLTAISNSEPLSAVIFLDCILKKRWLEIFQNRIVNAHSAILPRARGMYAIEQIAARGDPGIFNKAAGASLHYIDEKVDMGKLIVTQSLENLWELKSIWEVKASSYMLAFDLIVNYLGQSHCFSQHDCRDYNEVIGPEFKVKDFSEIIKQKAVENFEKMYKESQVLLAPNSSLEQLKAILSNPSPNIQAATKTSSPLYAAMLMPLDIKEKLELLIKTGANPNIAVGKYQNTALHLAIINEASQIAIFFIDKCMFYQPKKLDFNIRDFEKKTPLIMAVKTRLVEVGLYLIELNRQQKICVDLNMQDEMGRTALHYAVILGSLQLINALITAGINTDIIDNKNKAAFDYILCDEFIIIETLKAVCIDPKRDEYAISDFVTDEFRQPLYLYENKKIQLIKLCSSKNNVDQFEALLGSKDKFLLNSRSFYKENKLEEITEDAKKYILNLFEKMSGKTLLNKILEEHKLIDKSINANNNKLSCILPGDSPLKKSENPISTVQRTQNKNCQDNLSDKEKNDGDTNIVKFST